jgi:hypothetical protein
MKTTSLPWRILLFLLLGFVLLGPAAPASAAAPAPQAASAARTVPASLFDYIRGNRARMVQVTTLGLGLGLLILMTATRKN